MCFTHQYYPDHQQQWEDHSPRKTMMIMRIQKADFRTGSGKV